ncbi:MAG: amidohydrolase, partial [Phenylobacterium sp.]|nr:amidohydrolase [Phenylobacterium sp.]
MHRLFAVSTLALLLAAGSTQAQAVDAASVDAAVQRVTPQVVDWRRDFHQHPELGFAETRSAAVIADHLRS